MKRRALTLVEVVIALVILSLTAVGLTSVFVSSGQWIFHSRALMAGSEVGRNFMEPLLVNVSQRDWVDSGNNCVASNCLTGGAGCPGSVTVNNITYSPSFYNSTGVLATAAGGEYPCGRVRQMAVTVKWNETKF